MPKVLLQRVGDRSKPSFFLLSRPCSPGAKHGPAMLLVTSRIGFHVYMSKKVWMTSSFFWIARNNKGKGEATLMARLSGGWGNQQRRTVT